MIRSGNRSCSRAWLGLGSNMGDKRAMIARALDLLDGMPGIRVVARSGDYRTPPWGNTEQDWFVNACAIVETALSPRDLLQACLAIERRLGRQRTTKWGPRSIDIDLLDYEGETVNEPDLVLPHPLLLNRPFVLVPLAELTPDHVIGGTRVGDAIMSVDGTGIERLPD
jgi:2-amino-4-hydroxy-6-hydroxymethyldihydropteridine diphosphokinase